MSEENFRNECYKAFNMLLPILNEDKKSFYQNFIEIRKVNKES